MNRGMLIVVGGHSRGVGKTTVAERVLSARRGERWVAVKVSAHRHAHPACAAPTIERDRQPSPLTQTGRYLLAGASRAFLCRCPSAHLPTAATFVTSMRAAGAHVIVESNRIAKRLSPDLVLFAVAPEIDDWKPSSARIASGDALVVCRQRIGQLPPAVSDHSAPVFVLNHDGAVHRFAAWLDARVGRRITRPWPLIAHLALVVALFTNGAAHAQEQSPATPVTSAWRWSLSNVTRLEMWSFFQPPSSGGDPQSVFAGNRTRATLTHSSRRIDLSSAVQFVQFGGLPTRAIGPGFLGTGGLYYDHSRDTDAGSVYLPALNARLKLPRGVTVLGGRFGYTSGAESPSGRTKIESVKRARLDARLIGDFEWSLYQRAFDGLRADVDRRAWHVSAAWLRPTQGGFEEDAGSRINEIDVGAATLTVRPNVMVPATDVSAFVYTYRDHRVVTGRPDNSGRPVDRARVSVSTIGGSAVGAATRELREFDWLVWFAGQTGSWYEQSHRAWSLAVEGGHHWTAAHWAPWLRGGYLHASGDRDASDDRHATFFPMLPTVRRYALTTVYAPMNLNDAFIELSIRPTSRLRGRVDMRRLSLARATDRWYAGSGATIRRGAFFGYAGRTSGGYTDLGTVIEGSADLTITPHWSFNAFVGGIAGGSVVSHSFRGTRLWYGYVENVVQF